MGEISFAYQNPLSSLWDDSFLQTLPVESGVYFFLNENGEPLYIGKAKHLRKRLLSYVRAKPGQVGEHILEMLEHVHDICWELHPTEEAALIREGELIRALRPPYNIAGTEPVPYLYCGIRARTSSRRGQTQVSVDFRLSHREIGEDFTLFGCFPHRGKTKSGYSALLRLLFAATCPRERFHLPAKLCRSSPAYVYRLDLPAEWITSLKRFLQGESRALLRLIFDRLLERESLSPVLYAPLQRDFLIIREFYELGPLAALKMRRRAGIRSKTLSQSQLDQLVRKSLIGSSPIAAAALR